MDKKKDNLKRASYDVCFQPVVNVSVKVADPKRPTDDEMDMILREAAEKIGDNLDDKLSQENAAFIELYSVGSPKKDDSHILQQPLTVLDCTPPYIPKGVKGDVITKKNLSKHGWKYSRLFNLYRKSAETFNLRLYDNSWPDNSQEHQVWVVMVDDKDGVNIGKLAVTTYCQVEAFCQFVQTVLNQG